MRLALPLIALTIAACSQGATGSPPAANFKTEERATFNEPWAMSFLPGSGVEMTNMALVSEKAGKLFLVDTKTGTKTEVSGLPKPAYGGQGGFGDVVAHPGFAGNRLVYLSWVEEGPDGYGAVVGRAKLDLSGAPKLEGLETIWTQFPKTSGRGHFGHRLAFGPDGMLYISNGDRQKFTPAQDKSASLGKIVRLRDDGKIPGDNPDIGTGPAAGQIWSMGHRNPLGIAFDPGGRLWNTEMGPAHGDELNLVKRGANYGYPVKSNGSHYDGRDIPDHAPGDGFEAPKAWWDPAISPGSLMIYSGSLFPAWTGDAFIGALGGEALVRVDLDGENATKADVWEMKARIREVEQGPDGAIWLLTDGGDGKLLKLTPKG